MANNSIMANDIIIIMLYAVDTYCPRYSMEVLVSHFSFLRVEKGSAYSLTKTPCEG